MREVLKKELGEEALQLSLEDVQELFVQVA
jgi:hypothetical protein